MVVAPQVLETDSVLAFMDIGPIAAGHCLVIPKHVTPTSFCQKLKVTVYCSAYAARGKASRVAGGSCRGRGFGAGEGIAGCRESYRLQSKRIYATQQLVFGAYQSVFFNFHFLGLQHPSKQRQDCPPRSWARALSHHSQTRRKPR